MYILVGSFIQLQCSVSEPLIAKPNTQENNFIVVGHLETLL